MAAVGVAAVAALEVEGSSEDEVGTFVVEVFGGEVGGRDGGRLTGRRLRCGFWLGWHYWNKRNSGSVAEGGGGALPEGDGGSGVVVSGMTVGCGAC